MIFFPFYILSFGIFTLIKIAFSSIRFSDTNIYFYTAGQLIKGKLLYKDVFFTNFPLFPYISSLYRLIVGGHIGAYYLTSAIEAFVVSFLVYQILEVRNKNKILSFTGSVLYLFSFITLVTSDYQTGIYTASIFLCLSYFFWLKKRFFLTGLLLGLAFMTKAYSMPILIAFLVYGFFHERKSFFSLVGGMIITSVSILLPSIIFAPHDLIRDVFIYSLSRLAGVSKLNVASFFATRDPMLVFLVIFGVLRIRRNKLIGCILICSIIFFAIYQDIYYLYLQIFVPFIIFVLPDVFFVIQNRFKQSILIVVGVVVIGAGLNVYVFINQYLKLNTIENMYYLVSTIKKEKPHYLYGGMEITPLLSDESGIPLLPGVSDTNANIFRKHFLDAKKLTQDAVSKRSIIVAKGVTMDGYENLLLDEVYVPAEIKKHCRTIAQTNITTESPSINTLSLWKCY